MTETTLGERMKAMRVAAGLSLRKCAEKMGTPQGATMLWRWQHNETVPRVDDLQRFATACGGDISELVKS